MKIYNNVFTGMATMHNTPGFGRNPINYAAWAFLVLSQPSYALVNYVDLSLEQLLNVKVHSASKKDELIGNSPVAIYAVTSADIEKSGVTNIPDALRMVPGVIVARSDSNSWAISIRGFNSTLANKLLVLIDGRTIYNPVFGGVLWEAHDLMLEDIERIEVIRGPGGALWGANAVNGVINIITKHTSDTQGNLVSGIYGNEEQGTLSARRGGSFGETGSYRVYAKGFNRDASNKPQNTAGSFSADEDAYDAWDGVRSGFRMDWNDKFTFQGDAYRTNAEQLRPQYSLIAPYGPIREQTIVYEGINLLGRWTDSHANGSRLSAQTYVDWSKRDEPFNFVDERTTLDVDVQYDFAPTARHAIIAGAGIRYITDDKHGDINTSFLSRKDTDYVYSAFVQDKITLMPETWFLTLGTKVEHNEFSGWEVQPNARLHWDMGQGQTLWLAASKAVRTPTPIERNLTSTIATAENIRVAFVPNDNYKSEKLTAYEIGYRNQITPSFSVDVASFYNEYDHLTTFSIQDPLLVNNETEPLHLFIPVIFTNEMAGVSTGAEFVASWAVNENLMLSADYSYLHMSLEAIAPTQEGAETISPQHQLGAKVFWSIDNSWSLGALVKYVDKLSGSDVDDYVRMDINLGYQLTRELKFNIVGQNLLEKNHREFGGIDDINAAEVERSVFAKLTWNF
jgi:iron complex outermembrane receptor protein